MGLSSCSPQKWKQEIKSRNCKAAIRAPTEEFWHIQTTEFSCLLAKMGDTFPGLEQLHHFQALAGAELFHRIMECFGLDEAFKSPNSKGRGTFCYPRLIQPLSNLDLNTSRDGAAKDFLGKICSSPLLQIHLLLTLVTFPIPSLGSSEFLWIHWTIILLNLQTSHSLITQLFHNWSSSSLPTVVTILYSNP